MIIRKQPQLNTKKKIWDLYFNLEIALKNRRRLEVGPKRWRITYGANHNATRSKHGKN